LTFWHECIDANALVPWRIEYSVYGSKCFGKIDALFTKEQQLGTKRVYMFDWKRSTRSLVPTEEDEPGQKAQRNILQLDLLRTALHEHYGNTVLVIGMYLCRFNGNQNENDSHFELVQVV
jgi:hypothetical protein